MPLTVLIFTQKNKRQLNYKGLNFLYWVNVCACVCVRVYKMQTIWQVRSCIIEWVLQTYIQNIIRKSECDTVFDGKEMFDRPTYLLLYFLLYISSSELRVVI